MIYERGLKNTDTLQSMEIIEVFDLIPE